MKKWESAPVKPRSRSLMDGIAPSPRERVRKREIRASVDAARGDGSADWFGRRSDELAECLSLLSKERHLAVPCERTCRRLAYLLGSALDSVRARLAGDQCTTLGNGTPLPSWSQPRLAAPKRVELTPRQRESLQLLAAGASRVEIAEQLVLSPNTVRTHIEAAMERLDAPTDCAAVARAVALGLIEVRLAGGRPGG